MQRVEARIESISTSLGPELTNTHNVIGDMEALIRKISTKLVADTSDERDSGLESLPPAAQAAGPPERRRSSLQDGLLEIELKFAVGQLSFIEKQVRHSLESLLENKGIRTSLVDTTPPKDDWLQQPDVSLSVGVKQLLVMTSRVQKTVSETIGELSEASIAMGTKINSLRAERKNDLAILSSEIRALANAQDTAKSVEQVPAVESSPSRHSSPRRMPPRLVPCTKMHTGRSVSPPVTVAVSSPFGNGAGLPQSADSPARSAIVASEVARSQSTGQMGSPVRHAFRSRSYESFTELKPFPLFSAVPPLPGAVVIKDASRSVELTPVRFEDRARSASPLPLGMQQPKKGFASAITVFKPPVDSTSFKS